MTDNCIGLKWEHCFECCNRYYPFALGFAWEQSAYYDLNHFAFSLIQKPNKNNDFSPLSRKTGNLTLQGLTVSATIGF
jgi:hypothetical protein